MKWVVGVLFLANVALFMWGTWYHRPLVPLDIPTPPVEIAEDKMLLLSEPGTRLVLRTSGALRLGDGGDTPCYQLGPFPTLEKARAGGARLGTWGLTYERVAEFETLGPAYRVILPPAPSLEAAERKRRELTKQGFTDHAVVQNEQGMENAISLGIFAVEQNARARLQQLLSKGMVAQIQPVPNVHPVYWLAIAGTGSDGQIGGVPLERFSAEDWGVPNVQLRAQPCNGG